MPMKMSDSCKASMIEQFGFKNSELVQIENFMNLHNQMTAKEVLDSIIQDKKLNNKQKIIIAYVVGNSARESAIQEEKQRIIKKDIDEIISSGNVPPIGG